MKPKKRIAIAAGALILSALACTAPNVSSVEATANAAQATVIAAATAANVQLTPSTEEAAVATMIQQTKIAIALYGTQTAIAQPPPATITAEVTLPPAGDAPSPTPEIGSLPTNPPPQPTAVPPTNAPQTGSVMGKLCYPASLLPALTIYAKDVSTSAIFQQENAENQTLYTFANLPVAIYYFFAYTHPGTNNPTSIGIGYTQAVLCGLTVACTDHAMIPVTVVAGTTVPNVDICDGYDATAIPPKP